MIHAISNHTTTTANTPRYHHLSFATPPHPHPPHQIPKDRTTQRKAKCTSGGESHLSPIVCQRDATDDRKVGRTQHTIISTASTIKTTTTTSHQKFRRKAGSEVCG